MSADMERRRFVRLLGAGGLAVVAGPLGIRRVIDAGELLAAPAEPFSPHVYVTLHEDGAVTIVCHRSEMGQGVRTTLPMIIQLVRVQRVITAGATVAPSSCQRARSSAKRAWLYSRKPVMR